MIAAVAPANVELPLYNEFRVKKYVPIGIVTIANVKPNSLNITDEGTAGAILDESEVLFSSPLSRNVFSSDTILLEVMARV